MSYKALLFCPDEKTARVVTQVLSDLEFRVEPCNEPFAAVKKLMAEHFDAIVVDCDNEQNAALLFKSAHNSESNQASLAVAVVEGQAGVAKAFRIGANLVLTKPINVEQSKGTLRVARGLLRKTDSAKPAKPPAQPSPRPAVTTIDAKRPSAPSFIEPKSAPASLPVQPPPSPIPAVSASLFDVEDEPAPKPEPAEVALLESMPDPLGNKNRPADQTLITPASKEYPWQPVSKPAAGPMATALRRAAEAAGRSDDDSSTASKIPSVPDVSRPYSSGMASGQAAAAAPAKSPVASHEEAAISQVEAPTFSSLGAPSSEPSAGGSKKTILIAAAVLVALAAVGYVGWTKMHPASETPVLQKQAAPQPAAPIQGQPSNPAELPMSANPAVTSKPTAASSPNALPVEQGPDITLSTTETHAPAPKKTTSIVASNTVTRVPAEADTPAPIVVRTNVPSLSPSRPAAEEPAQPPALGSLGASANDSAISGIMSTTPVNLPRPAQKLKVSQGVSQGLLIKSVPPDYPPQAMKMHIQGAVELLAYISKDGSITDVKLIKGDAGLARAAIDAVKQWKYKPYYLNDQPVEIQTQITVNFKLP